MMARHRGEHRETLPVFPNPGHSSSHQASALVRLDITCWIPGSLIFREDGDGDVFLC